MQTEEWVERVEELLVGMRCTDEAAVPLVVTLLEGYARDWWRITHQTYFLGHPTESIQWVEFAELLLEHFIPITDRAELQEQFLHLRQGTRTVAQYLREFTHLARFAGLLAYSDRDRANRFFRGLRDDLRQPLIMASHYTLATIVAHASALEADQLSVTQRGRVPVRGRPQHRQHRRTGHQPAPHRRPPAPAPQPALCGPPPREPVTCFYCRQPGHYRSECPQLARGAQAPRGRGRGRAIARGGRGHPQQAGRGAAREAPAQPQQVFALEEPQRRAQDVVIGRPPVPPP